VTNSLILDDLYLKINFNEIIQVFCGYDGEKLTTGSGTGISAMNAEGKGEASA
jgi:hypothetical protein